MQVREGYKQTEVGVIPEDWEVETLGSLVQITSGESPSLFRFETSGIPYFKVDQLNNDSKFLSTTPYFFRKGKTVTRGSVIFPKRGASILLNKVRILEGDSYMDTNLMTLTPTESLDSEYLYYTLIYLGLWKFADTTSIPQINNKHVLPLAISLPQFLEQRAIAIALSDVDALLAAQDKLIAKKRDIKQAAMQQFLTGKQRLPGFGGEWEVERLGEVGDISSAGVDKKMRADETAVRLVNYLDVYRKDFIYSKDLNYWVTAPKHQLIRCSVKEGDIFFTPSSETRDDIGKSAVAMEDIPDAAYSYHVTRLRLRDNWNLQFRTYAFKTRVFLDQAEMLCDGSGTRYVISQGKFKSMTVQVPPLDEQTAIATVLSDMDADLTALELQRDKTRDIKQGMMQELLTGRIRLV